MWCLEIVLLAIRFCTISFVFSTPHNRPFHQRPKHHRHRFVNMSNEIRTRGYVKGNNLKLS